MIGLTARQSDCLAAIQALAAAGKSPSYDELARELGLASKGGVNRLVSALEERGFVHRHPNRARSITLVVTPRIAAVSPAALDSLTDEALRTTIAFCAGILAQRGGGSAGRGGPDPDSPASAWRAPDGGVR